MVPLTIALVGFAVLMLTWVVYPGVMVLLGRSAGRRVPNDGVANDGGAPTVTCVLATRDEPEIVAERVADFLAADYPADRLTVVVAVDAAAAGVLEALAVHGGPLADPRVTIVRGDDPSGKCPALNAAVRAASGEFLVLSDARQRFEAQTTRRLVRALVADPRLGATSGRLVLPRDEQSGVFRHYLRYELAIRNAESKLHSAVGVSGSVYAVRRELWKPLPAGLILDDLYLPMRLLLDGWRVGFEHDAVAHETRRVVASQEYRRKVRTLTGNFQLCAWLPGILVPFHNPIWAQFVCHKLLRLVTPWCAAAVALGTAWWVLTVAGDAAKWLVLGALPGTIWLVAGRDTISRKLRGAALQFGTLQAAVVTATMNGLRGRWDVWKA
jgi:cellulose synthase/poly-beta-1,6-N-acetylglucosamine synthase-like glycosyltransferase